MKSLPENEFWKAIGKRLENYQEDPADDWDKIAGAMASANTGAKNLSRSSDIVASVVLAFILGFQVAQLQYNTLGQNQAEARSAQLTEKILPKENRRSESKNNEPEVDQLKDSEKNSPVISEYNQRDVKPEIAGTSKIRVSESTIDMSGVISESTNEAEGSVPSKSETSGTIAELTKTDTISEANVLKRDTTVVSSPVVAQKEKRKKKFRPSVYFQLTPSMAYQKIIPSRNDQVTIQKINSPGVISADRFGWSAEAGFQMQVAPKLELYASLSYYQQQQAVSYDYLSAENPGITQDPDSWSFTIAPGSGTRTFNYNMRNVGTSAGVLYFLNGKKLMHKMGGGVFYQKGLMSSKEGDSYTNSNADYFGYQLLYRLEYVLSRKAGFFVQPNFSHSVFSNEELNEPFKIKPYRAGIGLGIVYHF
jgi:hypothetical protein